MFGEPNNIADLVIQFRDKPTRLITSNCSHLLVAGNELHALTVSPDQTTARFNDIGLLGGVGEEHIVDIQVYLLENVYILLIKNNIPCMLLLFNEFSLLVKTNSFCYWWPLKRITKCM